MRDLHLARGRPDTQSLVFPDSEGGHLRRQNWRRRVWIPALERAGVPYFRSYDLCHTCATLLLYEGRTLNEVADARIRTADPFITRKGRLRDARPLAGTRGHVLAGNPNFFNSGSGRMCPLVPELTYPFCTRRDALQRGSLWTDLEVASLR